MLNAVTHYRDTVVAFMQARPDVWWVVGIGAVGLGVNFYYSDTAWRMWTWLCERVGVRL